MSKSVRITQEDLYEVVRKFFVFDDPTLVDISRVMFQELVKRNVNSWQIHMVQKKDASAVEPVQTARDSILADAAAKLTQADFYLGKKEHDE